MLGLDGKVAVDARRNSAHKPARRRRAKAA
jgi:hypothetical protein